MDSENNKYVMEVQYDRRAPGLVKKNERGRVLILHNHSSPRFRTIYEKADIKGCIAFFKTHANNPDLPINEKAAVCAAIAEDEERLIQYSAHQVPRPKNCTIL